MTNPSNQDLQTNQDQLGPPRNPTNRFPDPFQPEPHPNPIQPVVEPAGGATQRTLFATPHTTILDADLSDDPDAPPRNRGPISVVNRANRGSRAGEPVLEGVASEVAPAQFVSQNYDNLVTLMQGEAQRRSTRNMQSRLDFSQEHELSPRRHRRNRREGSNHRRSVFTRIGEREEDDGEGSSRYDDEREGDDPHPDART